MSNRSSASSKRQKRRKSTPRSRSTSVAREQAFADSDFYEIRDIIDERVLKGQLQYKIDWADNPTTGHSYAPTWEPAANVTKAAKADWEKQKRRRQTVRQSSASPTTQTDSQPVLPPNWRAKRRREVSITVDEEGSEPSKRLRRSVDSGYTSTESDTQGTQNQGTQDQSTQASWAPVQSIPQPNGEIVLEISRHPTFDPTEYRLIPSQTTDTPTCQEYQKTIPDSQDYLSSLRTNPTTSAAQSVVDFPTPDSQQLDGAEGGHRADELQEPDLEGGVVSRSDLGIPSHQPESLNHFESSHTSALQSSLSPSGEHASGDRFSGFLTQPEDEPFDFTTAPVQSPEGESLELEPSFTGSKPAVPTPAAQSFVSAPQPTILSQDAQQPSVSFNNPGFLTQITEGNLEERVPETVSRAPQRETPPLNRNRLAASSRTWSLPSASRNTSMDGPKDPPPPGSAMAKFHELRAQFRIGIPPLQSESNRAVSESSPAIPNPTEITPQPAVISQNLPQEPPSSLHGLDFSSADITHQSIDQPVEQTQSVPLDAGILANHAEYDHLPATVAPTDLTTSIEQIPMSPGELAVDEQILEQGALDPATISLAQPVVQSSPPLILAADEQGSPSDGGEKRHVTVTLPMAANTRASYLEVISANKPALIAFAEFFSTSFSQVPDAPLVAKIDSVFDDLFRLCDLPPHDDDLPILNKEHMMKHATNSNSKFSFVHEFLNNLWGLDSRVLLISQPGRVFDYLKAIVSVADYPYTTLGRGEPRRSAGYDTDRASIILATADQDLSQIQGAVDVVILHDHTARSVEIPATLVYESTMVLSLVATYSLDHIHQQLNGVEPELDDLTRRNALVLGLGSARDYIRSPVRDHFNVDPHEAAKTFTSFLRNPEGGLDWDSHPLPADVLEFWDNSQERTQDSQADPSAGSSSRKRALTDIDRGIPKRPRLLQSQQPSRTSTPTKMSDLLKQTLANHTVEGPVTQVVEIPVDQLELMSSKIAELEALLANQTAIETKTREHCNSLEAQLRSHERTVQSIQPKYMDALRDRGTFEKQCQKAVEKADAAAARLEAQKAEITALKEKNAALEAKVAEVNDTLANSTIPDIAKVAQAEKDRDEALASVEKLEKKVRMVQNEADYSRKAYQDASNAHTELNQENQELKTQVAELQKRASDNLVKIQQIHAQTEINEFIRQIDGLQAMLENRERDLERAKDELKLLKNGRRETRQGSVSRSPRMGVMSPRPARGMGASSRGTSPAPMSSDGPGMSGSGGPTGVAGMNFFPPIGNVGRWGHLRD
ncbi:uncharacterized protein C8A04DRAFT_28595 [Dichotomopilus funicola]|uniref:Chromo domain-containing protein n=1 Tax=Dichotomopilus funicola TaxID=1934379 RepID=A0AAN6V2R1_9PEZI|nr:hypothetical protein C8A04DRAFT_28595 [Dichotomopilus funicola]